MHVFLSMEICMYLKRNMDCESFRQRLLTLKNQYVPTIWCARILKEQQVAAAPLSRKNGTSPALYCARHNAELPGVYLK